MFILTHKSGIYQIVNRANGKRYIGSSANLKNRRLTHFGYLRLGIHHNTHLQASYNKYDRDAFEFHVLLYCEPFELLRYEQFFIDCYKPEYNKNIIASSSLGVKRSIATREKIRQNMMNISQETRAKMSLSAKNKVILPETRAKMAIAHLGKKYNVTPEGHERLVQLNKNRKFTPETLIKISWASSHRSPEALEKIRRGGELGRERKRQKKLQSMVVKHE